MAPPSYKFLVVFNKQQKIGSWNSSFTKNEQSTLARLEMIMNCQNKSEFPDFLSSRVDLKATYVFDTKVLSESQLHSLVHFAELVCRVWN